MSKSNVGTLVWALCVVIMGADLLFTHNHPIGPVYPIAGFVGVFAFFMACIHYGSES